MKSLKDEMIVNGKDLGVCLGICTGIFICLIWYPERSDITLSMVALGFFIGKIYCRIRGK